MFPLGFELLDFLGTDFLEASPFLRAVSWRSFSRDTGDSEQAPLGPLPPPYSRARGGPFAWASKPASLKSSNRSTPWLGRRGEGSATALRFPSSSPWGGPRLLLPGMPTGTGKSRGDTNQRLAACFYERLMAVTPDSATTKRRSS